jgi:transglutaminase-like putative cysteine protease
MTWFRPLPRSVTQPVSVAVVVAWVGCMALVVNRGYLQASPGFLSENLARYGPTAVWHGVYYRGEKIGFTVRQTTRTGEGFELLEEGQLQMSLLGATTAAAMRTAARVDASFELQSFEFSLDPGTGAIEVRGRVERPSPSSGARRVTVEIASGGDTRSQVIELAEPPAITLNFSRMLANAGLVPGSRHRWMLFDPATLSNAPVEAVIGSRAAVRAGDTSVPAFRVEITFKGVQTVAWVTDTGEVVREESPLGLMTIREPAEMARRLAVPRRVQADLLRLSAVVPIMKQRIDEPRDVRRLRFKLTGADLANPDLQGAGQTIAQGIVEVVDARTLTAGLRDPDARQHLQPEPLIESDDPQIRAEAERAVAGVEGDRARAERLTRHVNAMLDKKPTVSLPSAREVLRTKVGDCNEHTVLYVAMARALGIPARIAVGMTYVRGAFYYHAWPEVYLEEGGGRGYWLPVDPTLNQFPADGTHLRPARGGLDKQSVVLPMIGRIKMQILDLELAPGSMPALAGRTPTDMTPLSIPIPQRSAGGCWSSPPPSPPPTRRAR